MADDKELLEVEEVTEQPTKLMELEVEEEELKGMAKVKAAIGNFFLKIKKGIAKIYNNTGFGKVLQTIFKYIGKFFYYLFIWVVLIKRKWYDKLTSRGQKTFVAILFLTPIILGFLIFYLYPMIMSLIYSFSAVYIPKDNPGAGLVFEFGKFYPPGTNDQSIIADFFGNYKYAFTELMFPVRGADFGSAEKISFIQALFETAGQTILDAVVITIFSLLIAVMLNGNFKGRGVARAIFFLPVILNSEAIEVATESASAIDSTLNAIGKDALSAIFDMKAFFTSFGIPAVLVNFLSGITSTIYSTISYSGVQILIFLAAIQSVPVHLYEAAKIEGATKYESFWKITLPMVSPMILTVVVYTIVDSFLRSDLSFYIEPYAVNPTYGVHAAISWVYILATLVILGIALLVLKKVVFYHDERN